MGAAIRAVVQEIFIAIHPPKVGIGGTREKKDELAGVALPGEERFFIQLITDRETTEGSAAAVGTRVGRGHSYGSKYRTFGLLHSEALRTMTPLIRYTSGVIGCEA